ncbi:MAG: capsule assembly Wzi family protein [Alloprevotella sp.]
MKPYFNCRTWFALLAVALLPAPTLVRAQGMFENAAAGLCYKAEAQVTACSDGDAPLWLNANRHGLSSTDDQNGYFRVALSRPAQADTASKWRLGYGLDLAAAYNYSSTFVVQQLYADFEYRIMRLSVGAKEQPAAFRNAGLSSGALTLGTNARPVPQVRFELPEYWNISGKADLVAIKGHFGYGMMTDGGFQQDYVPVGGRYVRHALLHTKAGYLRLGNEKKFPLTFEGGLEMACEFGGTIYNGRGWEGTLSEPLKMGTAPKDFINAIFGTGSDATDGTTYANAAGNTVGSWLFALKYKGKGWSARIYYDHFFEDHSQMFLQYGWRDGLLGAEITLPANPVLSCLVYESLRTDYQSGPLYHDYTEAIPDQISGIDNYYNHNLYQGWQHWGQAIGNPLFTSPLYNHNGSLEFLNNRFRAHHVGLSGDPLPGLHYRVLASFSKSWGTYAQPYPEVRRTTSLLVEAAYQFRKAGSLDLRGWSVKGAFGLDRGRLLGDNTGFQLTIAKSGLLVK